jgi:hypothetical protein
VMTWRMPVSSTSATPVARTRVMKVAPESPRQRAARGASLATSGCVVLVTRLQAELASDVVDEVDAEHLEGGADGNDRNR